MKSRLTALVFSTLFLAMTARAADIVALCIGNNAYQRVEDQLDTPVNDAQLMKATLESLPGGADVKLLTDATKEEIQIALNALKVRSQGAKLALVFYSGHGMDGQPDGFATEDTFLLPVDATIPDVNYLDTRAVSLTSVLAALKNSPVTARAVILDCCRSGAPKATAALAGATKNFGDLDERVKTALGKAVVPEATLVAFAASPGRKAAAFLTDADENSPFTKFLADELRTGAGNLRDLVEAAAETTETRTGKRQVPFVSYTGAVSAIRQISFRQQAVAPESMVPAVPAPATSVPPTSSAAVTPDQSDAGKVFQIKLPGDVIMNFKWCPAGSFTMGSPPDEQGHTKYEEQKAVTFSRGFFMGVTEVTQEQWAAIMKTSLTEQKSLSSFPVEIHDIGPEYPMYLVNWADAQEFVTKLNQKVPLPANIKFALPSSIQWEYACRAGSQGAYSFGNDPSELYRHGHFAYNNFRKGNQQNIAAGKKVAKVGSYAANAWGLHDMHGNVAEWCNESIREKRPDGIDRPLIKELSSIYCGGSYLSTPEECRAAKKSLWMADSRREEKGFRVMITRSE